MIDPELLYQHNQQRAADHQRDLDYLAERLARSGIALETLLDELAAFEVALPSWAMAAGGTRFGRFPVPGEPRSIFEKLEDAAVVHQLTRAAPRVSPHFPWDVVDDWAALRAHAEALGLGFDAVNSNTFQDQPGQRYSYKLGSLSHPDPAVRRQAIAHNLQVIAWGQQLGATALTVWLADGSNYPGQMHLRRSFERVQESLSEIYAALPKGWRLLVEYKPYEPAFYATVIQDWGSALLLTQALGECAQCLVDLGHHLPNANIELIVARLIGARKLGGFHFNDAKYGDDDLTAGSIKPYQLFLIFNELVDAAQEGVPGFRPAYMIDQSHNIKDPIEALLQTIDHLQRAYARALLIDRQALGYYQEVGDVLMAERTLRVAFETDVGALVAEVRLRRGGVLDPVLAFRESGYRRLKARERTTTAMAQAPGYA
uniref:Sugar isomerase n=1 Tax=Rhodothermus marinus TaxID=29549 RepID=A0A7V2B014_RHOMR